MHRLTLWSRRYIDDNTGAPYWYNPKSGTNTWVKPAMLGDDDIEDLVAVADPEVEWKIM